MAWFIFLAGTELIGAHGRASAKFGGDGRLITNFGLGLVGLASDSLLPWVKLSSSLFAQSTGLGLSAQLAWPWTLSLGSLVLAESLASYWSHRAMHALPLLWRIHRVHHCDSSVDVSTTLRSHPLELFVTVPVSAVVILAIGAPPTAVIASQTIMFAASMWQHADIELPRLERVLAPLLITPSIHRLHHSPERRLHDSNYGELVTLWDRLFGTFSPNAGRGPVGLIGQVARSDRLLEQIWSPVHAA